MGKVGWTFGFSPVTVLDKTPHCVLTAGYANCG